MFCPEKYAETTQKLFDLTFATFTITRWKLVEVAVNRRSDFSYRDWIDVKCDKEEIQQKLFWKESTTIVPRHLRFHLAVCFRWKKENYKIPDSKDYDDNSAYFVKIWRDKWQFTMQQLRLAKKADWVICTFMCIAISLPQIVSHWPLFVT